PRVIFTFIRYEIKRSIARRKIIVLAIFTLLIGTVPYIGLANLHHALSLIPTSDYPYLWVAGVFLPQGLFIQFTAILIAAGAMSEEYEQGTAELLLSKPVTKSEYFLGKFFGGYLLLAFIILLNMALAVISATLTFGQQASFSVLPGVFVAQAYAGLLFFTFAFMIGELIRRSSLSYIFSAALFFTSTIFGLYLSVIFTLTGNAFYRQVQLYLPSSPISSLPLLYASGNLPSAVSSLLGLIEGLGGGAVEPSILFSILLISIYFAAAFIAAFVFFELSDVSRKVS
ncbi:MAG: ABC transporter permease, partial [Nitrososphaerales archaeon]